ncbi:M23 family metallopeptidase [Robbsia andropogonis]|uniref:M23 family metallopeptidase n=1 Tax=Robbsia andropogonis TaxID=28092 RepID=UPI00209E24E0|nr:M23 family metallopeptidase [Robbsia andropogonis]MCP1117365.1 M23 family metallopeptidase [Robbsia andropogonis]MCP1129240.1 M23 family metallopeptidase [Robbsia andropogonis]
MIISYPVLFKDADIGDAERDMAFSEAMFPDSPFGSGTYPLSANLRWHGGVHLLYGTSPIACVADGKVVYVRAPTEKSDDPSHPLNYAMSTGSNASWTDDGCVVIEHEAELGKDTTIRFWSVYMHLSSVTVSSGTEITRKEIVGSGGVIAGARAIHFEIFTDQAGLDKLIKRGDKAYRVFRTGDNSGDPDLWGDMHFLLPAGTALFDKTQAQASVKYKQWRKRKAAFEKGEDIRIRGVARGSVTSDAATRRRRAFPEPEPEGQNQVGTLDKSLWLTVHFAKGNCHTYTYSEDGVLLGSAVFPGKPYEFEMPKIANLLAPNNQSPTYELLRYGRIVGEDSLPAGVGNWQCIASPSDGIAYVDLNVPSVVKLSDADFPRFLGWQRIHDGEAGTRLTSDGRCCAKAVLNLLDVNQSSDITEDDALSRLRNPALRKKMRRLVCEFRTEWDAAHFDSTYQFLLQDSASGESPLRAAMTHEQYVAFKAHANALQWWSDAALDIAPTLWHFHPIEFINWMRKCGWIDKFTLARIYEITPEATRERYRTALNQVMQKYVITNPIRQSHFLGQGAVESSSLKIMQEASNKFASRRSEAELGHWYGSVTDESDRYYCSEKFNGLGKRIKISYSWIGGNVGDIDAQKFRGRGFKQLTGRDNYAEYWVYRGWLKRSEFDARWWDDDGYRKRDAAQMRRRPASIHHPERLTATPYNCIDSGGFYIAFKRSRVKAEIDRGSGVHSNAKNDVDIGMSISRRVTYAINGGYNDDETRYALTVHALGLIN